MAENFRPFGGITMTPAHRRRSTGTLMSRNASPNPLISFMPPTRSFLGKVEGSCR